ncbi:MAG: Lon protease [Bifidobacteriaceae bacterium]|jgi:PDZ domain-containing protein|nr:Lon protease [Bifidobacteriaceae bacterium]
MPHSIGGFLKTGLLFLCLAYLFIPVPYCVENPGLTNNVLGQIDQKSLIQIDGYTAKDNGQLLMTTVSVQGKAQYGVPLIQALIANFNTKSQVLPLEAVFPKNISEQEYNSQNKTMMINSQNNAIKAAYNYLNITKYPKTHIEIDNVGGPSAGLIFALGIIDIVQQTNLTGGNIVAGTGQINPQGQVQPIGGIDQKIYGAVTSKAQFFIAPKTNCSDIKDSHPDIDIVAIDNLSQAIVALDNIRNNKLNSLPKCQN